MVIDPAEFLDHLDAFLKSWGVRLEVSGYEYDFELRSDTDELITRLWMDGTRIASVKELYGD